MDTKWRNIRVKHTAVEAGHEKCFFSPKYRLLVSGLTDGPHNVTSWNLKIWPYMAKETVEVTKLWILKRRDNPVTTNALIRGDKGTFDSSTDEESGC